VESLIRRLVVVYSLAGRAARAIREAAASGRPIASGGNGHAYRVWLRMNSFVGGYPMPHFKQAKPISLSL
jgi:hypothetical protein